MESPGPLAGWANAMPRPLLALALGLFAAVAPACVESHFEAIATQAAAGDVGGHCESTLPVQIERLSSYGYRAQTCEGVTFYRCWRQRKSSTQCCARVATEDEATSTFFAGAGIAPAVCRAL